MTSTSRRPPTDNAGADPWWGFDDQAPTTATVVDPERSRQQARVAAGSGRVRRRTPSTGPARVGWLLLGLLVAPLDLVRRRLARSLRFRRWAIRVAVVLAILTVLTCSVGVILINNIVIGRTAELGELDDRRRELRRDNALRGAQAARLSSPDVVFRRATRELGMVPTIDVPKFIYLVPGSKTLTPWQRRRAVERMQRQRDAAARAAAAKAAAAKAPAVTPAATTGDQ